MNIDSNKLLPKFKMLLVGRYLPDNATKSLEESPRALNLEMSWLRLDVGAGIPVLAAD